MRKTTKIFWGLIILALGVIGVLNKLEVTNIDIFFRGWWTLFIIVPSILRIIEGDSIFASLVCIVIGSVLLLACQEVLSIELISELTLPVILVFIGGYLICKSIFGTKVVDKVVENKKKNNVEHIAAVLGEEKRNIEGSIEALEVDAVFGHAIIDLKKAKIDKEATLKLSSLFGEINVILPEDVKVVVRSTKIFGGVSKKYTGDVDKSKKTIYIDAISTFGGIEIK